LIELAANIFFSDKIVLFTHLSLESSQEVKNKSVYIINKILKINC
jgi:hypothetical protein